MWHPHPVDNLFPNAGGDPLPLPHPGSDRLPLAHTHPSEYPLPRRHAVKVRDGQPQRQPWCAGDVHPDWGGLPEQVTHARRHPVQNAHRGGNGDGGGEQDALPHRGGQ